MLEGVTVQCFLASYIVVLAVEASRFLLRFPGRNVLLVVLMAAGLVAHSIFLFHQFQLTDANGQLQILANWFQWIVLGAWGLAVICLILMLRNLNGGIGLFLLPLVLGLIALAQLFRNSDPFAPQTTLTLWGTIHGVSLLVGTMFICLGLTFALMYLLQSRRLKMKTRPSKRFRLPTLEFLQSMNRMSLYATTILLGLGLVSGIVLNLNRSGQIAWFGGGILFSVALFVWTLIAALIELRSSGSLGGRRSAYLLIANFLIFTMVLATVLLSSHGQRENGPAPAENELTLRDSARRSLLNEELN